MTSTAIILAGGQSSRMKYNKEWIKIKDEFLVHIQIKQLQKLFDNIIVVTTNPDHYIDFDVTVVQDILEGSSPIIGLHSGLVHSTTEYNYCIACDMPFINEDYITFLQKQLSTHDAYVTKYHNFTEPFHAFYHTRIVSKIEQLVQDKEYGFQHMINTLHTHYITEMEVAPFLQKNDMFKNINTEQELFNIDHRNTKEYRTYDVLKVMDKESFVIRDKVITEYPLNVYLDKEYYITLMTTPSNLEFLVVGHLKSEGIIQTLEDVSSLEIDVQGHRCDVSLSTKYVSKSNNRAKILSSACGSSASIDKQDIKNIIVTSTQEFSLKKIFDEVANFNKESILFKETGGVHSVKLIYDDNELFVEDIGRHNAVDKAVGFMLKNNITTENKYIISSGRISSDILLKCATSGIALIVSRSAPTSLCINLATEVGVTVLGFARGSKVNIYTHGERIGKEDIQ